MLIIGKNRNIVKLSNLHECKQTLIHIVCRSTKLHTLHHHYYSKTSVPYNQTIINFHGGKHRFILTPYSL